MIKLKFISKRSCILRYWELGFQHMNYEQIQFNPKAYPSESNGLSLRSQTWEALHTPRAELDD